NRSIDRWFGEPARQVVEDAHAIENEYFIKEEGELASIARAITRSLSMASRPDLKSDAFRQGLREEMAEYNLALARVIAGGETSTLEGGEKAVEPDVEESLTAAEQQLLAGPGPYLGSDDGDSPSVIYVVSGVRVNDSAHQPRLLVIAREFPPELTTRVAN